MVFHVGEVVRIIPNRDDAGRLNDTYIVDVVSHGKVNERFMGLATITEVFMTNVKIVFQSGDIIDVFNENIELVATSEEITEEIPTKVKSRWDVIEWN